MVIKCLKYTNPEVAKKQKRAQVEARKEEKLKAVTEKRVTPAEAKEKLLSQKKQAAVSMSTMIDALEKHKQSGARL